MNNEQTCETCRYSYSEGRVCHRYPPVPLLSYSGGMSILRAVANHAPLVTVESALPATRPDNTCGEWKLTAELELEQAQRELQHMTTANQVLHDNYTPPPVQW
jgi:hypothetical protein